MVSGWMERKRRTPLECLNHSSTPSGACVCVCVSLCVLWLVMLAQGEGSPQLQLSEGPAQLCQSKGPQTRARGTNGEGVGV